MRQALVILTLLTALISAGCSNGDPGNYSDAPQLDFECSFVNATGCDGTHANKNVFIGLTSNLNTDCASKLALNVGDQIDQSFDYSARTTTQEQGGILVGVATHWVNSSLMPVIILPEQTFRVCAFIDLNDNNQIDVNEPYEESTISIGSSFLPLSNWSDY